jgi:hypothetical protein
MAVGIGGSRVGVTKMCAPKLGTATMAGIFRGGCRESSQSIKTTYDQVLMPFYPVSSHHFQRCRAEFGGKMWG